MGGALLVKYSEYFGAKRCESLKNENIGYDNITNGITVKFANVALTYDYYMLTADKLPPPLCLNIDNYMADDFKYICIMFVSCLYHGNI